MADYTSAQAAHGIIAFCNKHGDFVSNLRLQKLLYYAQAWHLALRDAPLFEERLEAWVHGPVQPTIYHTFKQFGSQPIEYSPNDGEFPVPLLRHITDVMKAYGSLSAYDLERLSHSEAPWLNARGGIAPDEKCTNAISWDDMKLFYRAKMDEQEKANS